MRSTTFLTEQDAVAKLEKMLQWIKGEIEHAIKVKASLEAANNVIIFEAKNVGFSGANCLSKVQQITALHLALVVAKLYETPTPDKNPRKTLRERRIRRWDRSDIASIPLIVRLLRHTPCQNVLAERARNWTPNWPERADLHERDFKKSTQITLRAYADLYKARAGRERLQTIAVFRNEALAHIRTDALLDHLPKYDDLFELLESARLIAGQALIAVLGHNDSFDDIEKQYTQDAYLFWQPAILAAFNANRWDRD